MSSNLSLRPREFAQAVLACAGGGFVGTLLRTWLTGLEHLPSPTWSVSWPKEIPWALLIINFVGVFLATRLLRGPLRHRDPNDLWRILVITGFFGGFTSFSSLYLDVAVIWHLCVRGALFVIVGALASGVVAAWLGLVGHR